MERLNTEEKRLYVLIDKRLDPVYGCVQGGHAVAQYLLDFKNTQTWNNNYLIYLYADVKKWKHILLRKNIHFSSFHEPDLDNRLTAIAVENDGSLFKHLHLVK